MRSLIIIRHAKSSWDFSGMKDFDRPLNERGHRDAPVMAGRLIKRNISIDAFVSSTANRALTTATYFAEAYGLGESEIVKVPALYHAQVTAFNEVVSQLNNDWKTVALFSHNPGITEFVNNLTPTQIDNMPTCGVFAVTAEVNSWQQFNNSAKTFWFFDYPKAI